MYFEKNGGRSKPVLVRLWTCYVRFSWETKNTVYDKTFNLLYKCVKRLKTTSNFHMPFQNKMAALEISFRALLNLISFASCRETVAFIFMTLVFFLLCILKKVIKLLRVVMLDFLLQMVCAQTHVLAGRLQLSQLHPGAIMLQYWQTSCSFHRGLGVNNTSYLFYTCVRLKATWNCHSPFGSNITTA